MNPSFTEPAVLNPKISLEQFETALDAVCAVRYRPYAGALVSYAVVPWAGEEAGLVSCRWEFVDELAPARATVTYPALVLEDRWFPIADAARELLRILRGEAALGGRLLRQPVSELEPMDTTRQSFTGWPEKAFEASLQNGFLYDRTPVVAKGLRPYPSIALAVSDWVWREKNDTQSFLAPMNVGKLRVLLPDTRARIRASNWVGGTLMLLNDRNVPSDDVELQGVIVERRIATMLDSRAVEREVTWEVPAEADVIEVYLVHRDGTLLSHRQLKRGEHYSARPGDFALRERAEEEVRQGEGERVEYKPFIEAGDRKENELIRTVVAFSNTFGGRVYLGVEDDGTLQGESQLRSTGKASEQQTLASMVARIEKLVREKIKPVPDVRASPATAFGNPIIIVDVLAGEEAPYSTFENDVFIRRGATNRKPDPHTELPSIVERARARRERRERQERYDAFGASSYQKGDD